MQKLNTQFRRGMEHNYLIIKYENEDGLREPNDYQTYMLMENHIRNMLELQVRRNDGAYEYQYEISSLQPLARVFEHRLAGFDDIRRIILGIIAAFRNAHEYMLDDNCIVLNPEYIYTDIETGELKLLIYPYYSSSINESFMSLAEFILDKTDHNENKAVMLAYDFFKMVRSEAFTLSGLDTLVEKIDNDKSEKSDNFENKVRKFDNEIYEENETNENDGFGFGTNRNETMGNVHKNLWDDFDETEEEYREPVKEKKSIFASLKAKSKKTSKNMPPFTSKGISSEISKKEDKNNKEFDYEDYDYHYNQEDESITDNNAEKSNGTYGKTVLLSKEDTNVNSGAGILVYSEGHKEKTIDLSVLPLTIGKVSSCVDVVINDSSVSRMHATVFREDGMIKIKDLDSTNGTYVNSIMLSDGENMPLEKGDEIKLGKVILEYR